jgi:hypothetical protein
VVSANFPPQKIETELATWALAAMMKSPTPGTFKSVQ